MDKLSELPVDIFIETITHLPFSEVTKVCVLNKKLHNYCNDPKYNNHWKRLIDDTFGSVIYNYQTKLEQIWNKLNLNPNEYGTYNYLVYTKLVVLLDPITQLMIYYRQKDIDSFNNPKFTELQRFLASFLLQNSALAEQYLPHNNYLPSINILKGKKVSKDILDLMMSIMAKEGNVKGVKMFLERGADIHAENDRALRWASAGSKLEVVKYLVSKGADIHAENDMALRWASRMDRLDVVNYLKSL